jgi:CBS domain containing-hemolysin-like protein
VTLEDVLEAIVGDLQTADQPEEHEIVELSESEYEVSGRLSVRYWPQLFGLPPRTERVATVGGLVSARLGRPARAGDVVRLGNVELRVLRLKNRRVERLRVRLVAEEEPGPAAAGDPAGSPKGKGGSGNRAGTADRPVADSAHAPRRGDHPEGRP